MIFSIDLGAVPEDARRRIEEAFQQVAEAVAGIAASSPFFASLGESVMQIDVEGWRLGYNVDPRHRQIRVIEATPLRRRRG